jgi:hypothetical protein
MVFNLKMNIMYWLVNEMVVEKEDFDPVSMSKNIGMLVCIRKVEAATKEEAIGKFILDTASIKFVRRVDPIDCFEFDKLRTI